MKTKKINLSDLRVKSFVTNLEKPSGQTIVGGQKVPKSNVCPDSNEPCFSVDICSL
ncbi:pinensin family lanthipeptide [Fulvivirga kasyanovii]|uniref:pinensin family lanthipeptide n=1 Tax=Fulvivirga kasyanovii TaxID=396812 RepID=UPI0012BBB9C6|nr:pinensin family lanthipeptide [Fulvivirga kasyanovii]